MPEAAGQAGRWLLSWRGDVVLAAFLAAWTLTFTVLAGPTGDQLWWVIAFLPPYCAALLNDWVTLPFILTPFLVAYSLGTSKGIAAGLVGAAVLAAGLQIQNGSFVPIFPMMTFGPWIIGRVALSRRKLNEQLKARNSELAEQQEIFARESVRYERARIARELHDIVAHCLSVMVVQASAGQRVAAADRDGVAEALESVAEAAAQAQTEVGRLVELLSSGPTGPAGPPPGLAMVDELVRRASGSGLAVSC